MLEARIRLRQGKFTLDADFAAPADAITALWGPSGAGKSTVLAVLAGLKRCEGRIALDGRVYADSAAGLHVPPHRRGFGLLFQDARLFPHLTARQNIRYAARRAPHAPVSLEELAGFFEIAHLLDRPIGNLSGGEKSRVGLARALASAPQFLLLDEPFAALDGARRRSFIAVLSAARQRYQIPMIVVTHSIDDAAALASHVVVLNDGVRVAQGRFAEVVREPQFQALLDPHDVGAVVPLAQLRSAAKADMQRLWLRADHVLVAAAKPQALSARNVVECRVAGLSADAHDSMLVALDAAIGFILARLTAEAVRELALVPGKTVWAIVKAHAV